jgi:hypothetical protein
MSTKKTIQINPELFKISGNKTKKNREKKELLINPVVSPNNLKNKLLKRIKEHKTKELNKSNTNTLVSEINAPNSTYTDEFYGAIDYLSDLSKKQKQQKTLYSKTLKNPSLISPDYSVSSLIGQQISLDLPPELAETTIKTQPSDIFTVNYKPIDDVPYGCLKNGKKKTYREWKELTNPTTNFELPNMIRPPTPPKKNLLGTTLSTESNIIAPIAPIAQNSISTREQRLEQIKNKLRKIQEQESSSKMQTLKELDIIEKRINNNVEIEDLPDFDENQTVTPNIEDIIKEREEKIERSTPKKYLKRTVKRRFTLGRSNKLRCVSILIKDKQTRKNVINTQKELKKTNITDVRKYLRQHGIIKVGSTCPTDILRKTFESAMLAGEVTNINKETLLHNFLNEEKQ